jgi:hypothetical protein
MKHSQSPAELDQMTEQDIRDHYERMGELHEYMNAVRKEQSASAERFGKTFTHCGEGDDF